MNRRSFLAALSAPALMLPAPEPKPVRPPKKVRLAPYQVRLHGKQIRTQLAQIVADESVKLKKPLTDNEQHAMVEALLCCRNHQQRMDCINCCLQNRA